MEKGGEEEGGEKMRGRRWTGDEEKKVERR